MSDCLYAQLKSAKNAPLNGRQSCLPTQYLAPYANIVHTNHDLSLNDNSLPAQNKTSVVNLDCNYVHLYYYIKKRMGKDEGSIGLVDLSNSKFVDLRLADGNGSAANRSCSTVSNPTNTAPNNNNSNGHGHHHQNTMPIPHQNSRAIEILDCKSTFHLVKILTYNKNKQETNSSSGLQNVGEEIVSLPGEKLDLVPMFEASDHEVHQINNIFHGKRKRSPVRGHRRR